MLNETLLALYKELTKVQTELSKMLLCESDEVLDMQEKIGFIKGVEYSIKQIKKESK